MIRIVRLDDAEAICNIYNYHVENTIVTFEETVISIDEMRQRIKKILKTYPWIVYEIDGKVIGYAYASEWKTRSAYRYSVESTIYLDMNYLGKGIGTKLYRSLMEQLRERDIHCIIAGIALPNDGSVCLHEKLGFEKVAHFSEVGYKFEKWIDVGYWQLTDYQKES